MTTDDTEPARDGSGPPSRARIVARVRRAAPDDYGYVLALLTASYVLFVFSTQPWVQVLVVVLQCGALALAVRTSQPGPRLALTIRVVIVLGLIASGLSLALLDDEAARGVTDAVLAVVLLVTLVIVLDRVLSRTSVTLHSIAAALSGYLLLGMLFSNVFGVATWLQGGEFFADGELADGPALHYFSFTTLTTLGYGDLTAATNAGRGLATFEALVAQVYLVTIVARLVAAFPARQASREAASSDERAAEPVDRTVDRTGDRTVDEA
ncbi:potassium channel family protein [Cellulomonas composti]|uniref:Potassium channel domain-containing protein n=1 Tax=Cellulomonas composti TaxID=266130 RepID=A0A511J6W7_9CELL|nr:potassium channel family protein [Cellulomonas composti]GEL93724.1 hypothetical protein CCO02nite_03820 [Cellulomonas composti]